MKRQRYISIQTIEGIGTHAIYKAREDVNKIVRSCSYTPITFGSTSRIGFVRVLKRYYDIFSIKFKLRKSDNVFFQFPWIHNNKPAFYNNLFGSGAHIQCVVHDLDSLRGIERKNKNEIHDLSRCHSIIAHTPAMKQFLVEKGIEAKKIHILYLFPYLTEDKILDLDKYDVPTIIFAGNITKSPFVNELHKVAGEELAFNIYGNGAADFKPSKYVEYKGVFSPDHPGVIEGNWGLVWDGSALDTCNGLYGEYLRYNSSHKVSLYLSLGIPVILWSQSSLRQFVEERNLGITVDSLENLYTVLSNLSSERLKAIRKSVREYAPILRNGDVLRMFIEKS